MNRHPFDVLSAMLGLLVCAVAVHVMLGGDGPLTFNGGVWLPLVALAIGVSLIPRLRRRPTPDARPE
ncbi:MAG: hypothetical protein WCC60_02535 [Ilumatobacteraceae bacterium]